MTTLLMASGGARRGLCVVVAGVLASQSWGMAPPIIESLGRWTLADTDGVLEWGCCRLRGRRGYRALVRGV